MRSTRWPLAIALSVALAVIALPAAAHHDRDPRTRNLRPKGHIEETRSFPGNVHTDIAFWGNHAFQGSWLGFNIRDISNPDNPTHVSSVQCTGPQGDMVIWDDILVRTWDGGFNSRTGEFTGAPPGQTCGGEPVPEGFAGLHIFDVSNPTAPELVGEIEYSGREEADSPGCGSHTATGVPDPANDRLLIYNGPSTGACPWFEIAEIPFDLDDVDDARFIRRVQTGRPCHDNGVILGDAMRAACAGGNGFTVVSMDPADGGSLDDPVVLYSKNVNDDVTDTTISIGHSAAFTWDGEVLLFGHEPGGGVQAQCERTDPEGTKSLFFFDTDTGSYLGQWVLPRPQTGSENCTVHNYNVVPLENRYVVVSGNYQAGTWVTEFTDPANPRTVAWSDPRTLGPGPFCSQTNPPGCQLGGVWSSYWYNGFIYETNITEGLNVFLLLDEATAGAQTVGHLNPQTQEFTIG